MATKAKRTKINKLDQQLTVRAFLEGLDKFYDGKIEPQFKLIDRRFVSIDRRFVSIENKLNEHDKKFSDIHNHIDGLYKKFEDLKIEYQMINAALQRIESYIKQDQKDKKLIKAEILGLKTDVASLTSRIEALEKQAVG
jgi:chromosome segregation ATPase